MTTTMTPAATIPTPACAVPAAIVASPIGLGVAALGCGYAGYRIAKNHHIIGTVLGLGAGCVVWFLGASVLMGSCAAANPEWLAQQAQQREQETLEMMIRACSGNQECIQHVQSTIAAR
jgi:hypothetical protein